MNLLHQFSTRKLSELQSRLYHVIAIVMSTQLRKIIITIRSIRSSYSATFVKRVEARTDHHLHISPKQHLNTSAQLQTFQSVSYGVRNIGLEIDFFSHRSKGRNAFSLIFCHLIFMRHFILTHCRASPPILGKL